MPRLTRWFIRAALLALILGLGLGVARGFGRYPVLDPTVLHLLVVGWLTQMIFGVAIWLFPRHSADRPRGYEPLSWLALASLNAGLVLRVAAEPGVVPRPEGLLAASGILQLVAGVAFAAAILPRVKEKP